MSVSEYPTRLQELKNKLNVETNAEEMSSISDEISSLVKTYHSKYTEYTKMGYKRVYIRRTEYNLDGPRDTYHNIYWGILPEVFSSSTCNSAQITEDYHSEFKVGDRVITDNLEMIRSIVKLLNDTFEIRLVKEIRFRDRTTMECEDYEYDYFIDHSYTHC